MGTRLVSCTIIIMVDKTAVWCHGTWKTKAKLISVIANPPAFFSSWWAVSAAFRDTALSDTRISKNMSLYRTLTFSPSKFDLEKGSFDRSKILSNNSIRKVHTEVLKCAKIIAFRTLWNYFVEILKYKEWETLKGRTAVITKWILTRTRPLTLSYCYPQMSIYKCLRG